MTVSTIPWGNTYDLAAVGTAIDHVVSALNTVKGLTFLEPAAGQTGAEYVASVRLLPRPLLPSLLHPLSLMLTLTSQVPLTYANIGSRRANHWLGTAKIGTDSGLTGGTAVVDLNTKVYGTDNIFVVDASIFPGMPSTNPSSLIVIAAEHASDLILALPPLTAVAHVSFYSSYLPYPSIFFPVPVFIFKDSNLKREN